MSSSKFTHQGNINFYDDQKFNYEDFWIGRDYEHQSEVIALKKLLAGKHYETAMDYGGGYGRLSKIILEQADHLYLVEPSKKQLELAKIKLKDVKNVDFILLTDKNLIPVPDKSMDLVVMVRVSLHLTELNGIFSEIERILKPKGQAIIEIANYVHIINRLKYLSRFKRLPKQPTKIGSISNGIVDDTPFVNHNPKTVANELKSHQLKIINTLSVSNFRNGSIKKVITTKRLTKIESLLQQKLAPIYFGPSIFFMVEKALRFGVSIKLIK